MPFDNDQCHQDNEVAKCEKNLIIYGCDYCDNTFFAIGNCLSYRHFLRDFSIYGKFYLNIISYQAHWNFRRITKYKKPGRLCRHLALTHKVYNFPTFSTKQPNRVSKQRQKNKVKTVKVKVDTRPTQKRRWQCEIDSCNRWFASRHNVNVHVLSVHENRREHVCVQCARTFQRVEHLKQHTLRTHTNTRPFKCIECEASFNDKQYLRKHHINMHTDLLPYSNTSSDEFQRTSTRKILRIIILH